MTERGSGRKNTSLKCPRIDGKHPALYSYTPRTKSASQATPQAIGAQVEDMTARGDRPPASSFTLFVMLLVYNGKERKS